jgi:hypothetical protein
MTFLDLFSIYKNWNNDNTRIWQLTKQKGLLHYVLVEGVLVYGGISFCSFMLFKFFFLEAIGTGAIKTLVLWFTGAVLYGLVTWYATEKSYKRSNLKPAKD